MALNASTGLRAFLVYIHVEKQCCNMLLKVDVTKYMYEKGTLLDLYHILGLQMTRHFLEVVVYLQFVRQLSFLNQQIACRKLSK